MSIADTHQVWVDLKTNLHRFIARRASSEADADDILQEVFVKIHTNIGRLRDSTRLHSWVYQITRNAITDYYRTRRNDLSLDASPDAFEIAEEEPAAADAGREEIIACLAPMVERLPDEYRRALEMSDVSGMKQSAVASELNISLSGAKSRVQRARGKMKDMLLDCCKIEFDRLGRAVSMDGGDCSPCGEKKC